MDNLSAHPSEFDLASASAMSAGDEVTGAIGAGEHKMHVRAYNYWVSLLGGRDHPSIENLEFGSIGEFAPNSFLLDFTAGRDDPVTSCVGTAIRAECGLPADIEPIAQLPRRSLLTQLAGHYPQVIADRAPSGVEAIFVNQRGHSIFYRGILMPFSSDGDTIDFIYGVIDWKDAGAALEPIEPAPDAVLAAVESEPRAHPGWEDGPLADWK